MSAVEARDGLARWLPLFATAIVLVLLVGYLFQNRGVIAESYSLDPVAFIEVAALGVFGLVLRGFANQLHFRGLGVTLASLDWFRLVTMTSFTNYLPLSAGLIAKAVFLKRVHDVSYGLFAVGQTTLLLLVLGTNGMTGLLILAARFPDALLGVVGAGFLAMALCGALLFLPDFPDGVRSKLSARWLPLASSGPRSKSLPVAGIQLLMLLVSSLALWLCFGMGDSGVGLVACVLFTAASVITRFVTIVPGALGVRELLIGALASLVGFDLRDAIVAATLARAAEIVVVFALGGALTWSFSRELTANGGGDE